MPRDRPVPELHHATPPVELDAVLAAAPRPRRRWVWSLAALGILVLAAAVFVLAGSRRSSGRFRTEPVVRGDLTAVVSATGRLEPTNQVDVGSELSGTVTQVLADTNDTVEAGQVLARLDTTKVEQQADRSRAALESARARSAESRATREEAAANLARYEELARLSAGKMPSRTELDAFRAAKNRADAAWVGAEAAVAEAIATLRANETDLSKSVIRAPIEGIVLDRSIEPGQTVAASFQAPVLFTIAQSLEQMDLIVNVAEADVGSVKVGLRATFAVDAWPDRTFDAVVRKVKFSSTTVENVVSYQAELHVNNENLELRPGMTATAEIRVAERRSVLTIAAAALRFRPPMESAPRRRGFSLLPRPPQGQMRQGQEGDSAVWVLREDLLERVPVTTGLTDGNRIEITSGALAEGDRVVLEVVQGES